jgi:hypothetical protein
MTQPNGEAKSCEPMPEPQVKNARHHRAAKRARRPRVTAATIRETVEKLEVPFEPAVIEWRVTSTSRDRGGNLRGLLLPYADQRAYTDRLNALLTPAGWTRKYTVHTSAGFERGRDGKTVSKVFVTCELNIFGLGSHSATGEEWTDDENAGTSAEAQAFKRACSCFGLGRYLYYFSGKWVDLDDRKRPLGHPALAGWATPEGWKQGLRPGKDSDNDSDTNSAAPGESHEIGDAAVAQQPEEAALVRQIEAMAGSLGRAMYRGLLKSLANAWEPGQIREAALLRKLLDHMEAARRGLRRLELGLERTGTPALNEVLASLKLRSMNQVNSLETLLSIVLAVEAKAELVCDQQEIGE